MKSRTYSFTREKVVAEAERRGWHVRYFGPDDYFYEISTPDSRSCIFRGSMPQTSAWIGGHISEHKLLSLEYLRHLGLMPPPFAIYTNDQDDEQFLRQYSPIVVKPEDSERSQGVTVNVTDMARLHEAVAIAREFSDQVILQQQLEGKLYRLLAIGGKFCAAFARLPAFVLGRFVVRKVRHRSNPFNWRVPGNIWLHITKISTTYQPTARWLCSAQFRT